MTLRVLAALPLLLGSVGCLDEAARPMLVGKNDAVPVGRLSKAPRLQGVSEVDPVVTRRVLAVGGQLVDANPQLGIRPMFITVGAPHPEIFHKGGGTSGYQIFISEGLVKLCKDDEQLAAVLAIELGKIITARGPEAETRDSFRLPPDVPIGREAGGTFGPADGTRMMELAQIDPKRPKPGKLASPEALAKTYLTKAGYGDSVARVAPLLRKADENYQIEKSVKTVDIGAPVASGTHPGSEK